MRKDINLIPKKINIISAKMMFLFIIIAAGSILLMGFCGLLLPLREKDQLKKQIEQQQKELLLYSSVEDTYITLTEQINNINKIDSVFKTIKSNNLKMTELFQDLQKNIPRDIIIQNISYSDGELLMEGLSPTYMEIAGYIVNLRKLDYVLNVAFTSAEYETPLTDMSSVTNTNNRNEDIMYRFNVVMSLKTYEPPTAVPAPQEGNTTDEKGGK